MNAVQAIQFLSSLGIFPTAIIRDAARIQCGAEPLGVPTAETAYVVKCLNALTERRIESGDPQ